MLYNKKSHKPGNLKRGREIRSSLQYLFRKAFGIYPGEGTLAFRFARLAIFWAFGSSCLDTLSDSLFLRKVGGEDLLITYRYIAIGMITVSSLVLYILRVTNPYRVLTVSMALGSLICLGSAFMVAGDPPMVFWYIMKIASKMFFALMIAISWTFTDQYHDLQDAKRVYSIYSAAYFVGVILAGTAINLFQKAIGFSGLLVCSAVSILLGLLEARRIARKSKAVHDDSAEGIFSGNRDSFSTVVKLILGSKFTIILLLLSLFMQLLWTVTEFNYLNFFENALSAGGEEAIAAFLGKCRALISLSNIIIGLFIYGRFVRRAGLNNAILVTPLFFLMVYCGWLCSNTLAFAVLGLIAVDGILFTVEDNCFNLLSNAVPTKIKSKVRIINDSFFEATGMLLTSLVLNVIESDSGTQSSRSWLGFSLTLVALALTFAIRGIYSKTILINLKENALHFERKLKD